MKFNKINLSFAVFILGFFLVSHTASAQTSSTTSDAIKPDIRKAVETRKEVREEKKMEVKNIKEANKVEIKDLREKMIADRKDMKGASTTEARMDIRLSNKEAMENFKTNRKEVLKKMKTDEFQVRANALVKQLTMSLENLVSIRTRVSDVIAKQEAEGKVLTEAKAALAVADTKIESARTAVSTLASLTVSSSTPSTNASSTETDLTKPRQVGDAAIKAVKDARDSLKVVVRAIAIKSDTASSTPINN